MARTAYGDWLLWVLTFAIGTAMLASVAIANGGPILYPDSIFYVADGEQLVRLAAPNNMRPIFYGLAIWPLHWERTIWPVLLVQGLVVAHIVYLTLRVAADGVTRIGLLLALLTLTVATPLSWHISHVLPDVFSGVLIPTLFLLGCCRDRLSKVELGYLVLLAAAAISFHLTNLVTAGAIAGIGSAAWFWRRTRPLMSPLLLIAPIVLALGALLSVSVLLYGQVSVAPKSPPHMMARMIADGPGRDYLARECPSRHFQICRYLDQLPATEDEILWRFLPTVAGTLDPKLFRTEDSEIVRGTMRMFPVEVARNMIVATARQLVTISSRTDFRPDDWAYVDHADLFWTRGGPGSLQAKGVFDGNGLDAINRVHAGVALLMVMACIVLAWLCARARLQRPLLLLGVLLIALPANAFATGALGGVFGRYGGRVIWVLPLAAMAAAASLRRTRVAIGHRPAEVTDDGSAPSRSTARPA